MRNTHSILNINISDISENALLENFTQGVLFTPNVDHLVNLQRDAALYHAYKKADYVVCDSKILQILSLLLPNIPFIRHVIPGSGFFPKYYKYHKANNNVSIFLLGAATGVGEKAKSKINDKVKREMVVATYSPPWGFENDKQEYDKMINLINASHATVLVVGLGSPKQEIWINKNREKLLYAKTIMALGATIDFEASTLKRAPLLFQKLSLEWLYRFSQEPNRLFRRYFIEDPKIVYYIIKQSFGKYKNPHI